MNLVLVQSRKHATGADAAHHDGAWRCFL